MAAVMGAAAIAAGFGASLALPVAGAGGVGGCATTGFDTGAGAELGCPATPAAGAGSAGAPVAGVVTGPGALAAGIGFPGTVCAGALNAEPAAFVPGCPDEGCGLPTTAFEGGADCFGSSPPMNSDIARAWHGYPAQAKPATRSTAHC